MSRRPGWFKRAYAAFATTRVARFLSRHVSWHLDPVLLRLTGGRLASTLGRSAPQRGHHRGRRAERSPPSPF